MERYLQNASATLAVTFEIDGTPTDPSPASATVEIVRDNGDILVSAGEPTTRTGTGTFAYPLTPTMTSLLDVFTVRWTSSLGTITTTAEIVGGFFFSLSELKAINLGGTKTIGSTYSDEQLLEMRSTVEEAIEDACGFAFVPRYGSQSFGHARWPIRLKPYLRALRSVTVGGVAYTPAEVSGLAFDENGFVYGTAGTYYSRWVDGEALVPWAGGTVVGYEHGLDSPPMRVKQAALLLAKVWIVSGPVDDRVTTMSSPDTGITAALAVPGRGGSIVGVPEVDATIQQYRLLAVA